MKELMTANVQILLSTYNGEKYLPELLGSVLAQDYPSLKILIRDDGSNDRTRDILKHYEKLPQVEVIYGENKGAIASFFTLLDFASDRADYYAFCDQDDVWLKNKISRAVFQLAEKTTPDAPAMYCSRLIIVDERLSVKGYSKLPLRGPSFCNALVQNIATGCTMVINSAARQCLLKKIPAADNVKMYDWWIYLVFSALGTVIYDFEPLLLYRQHSANVLGMPVNPLQLWKNRLESFCRQGRKKLLRKQACTFLDLFADQLTEEQLRILQQFIKEKRKLTSRLHYSLHTPLYRHSFMENLLLRILILFDRI